MTNDKIHAYARFGWPVGAQLRFRLDAELPDEYRHLRGTRVRVVSPPFKIRVAGQPRHIFGWGQSVIADEPEQGESIASPGLLEPIPGVPMLPARATADGATAPTPKALH